MMVGLLIFRSSAVTSKRGYATMSVPVMALMILLFGAPALYDLTVGAAELSRQEIVHNLARLAVGVFSLYCAVRVYQGKRHMLTSRGTVIAGHFCFGFLLVMVVLQFSQFVIRANS